MPKSRRHQVLITVGVGTHASTHVAAVVDNVGRVLGTESFAAGTKGYGALVAWAASYGQVVQAGVEGTGSYGAGLKRLRGARSRCGRPWGAEMRSKRVADAVGHAGAASRTRE